VGRQKPGFLRKYFVHSHKFPEKPGFFGLSARREIVFFATILRTQPQVILKNLFVWFEFVNPANNFYNSGL